MVPAACLLATFLLQLVVYKLLDRKFNRLSMFRSPLEVEMDIPQASDNAQMDLLENDEDREYDPDATILQSKLKKTMQSMAMTFKGKKDSVYESVAERRTESRVVRIENVTCGRGGIQTFFNFSTTFMSNRINTIVGKNGSGKT
jgi:ATPase subunit of ABC transporter with duplicated ATPase domains